MRMCSSTATPSACRMDVYMRIAPPLRKLCTVLRIPYIHYSSYFQSLMHTAEPARKKAYHEDLRWRIVYQRIARNLTFVDIARNLSISTSTAQRIFDLFQRTGGVVKTSHATQCAAVDGT